MGTSRTEISLSRFSVEYKILEGVAFSGYASPNNPLWDFDPRRSIFSANLSNFMVLKGSSCLIMGNSCSVMASSGDWCGLEAVYCLRFLRVLKRFDSSSVPVLSAALLTTDKLSGDCQEVWGRDPTV